MTDITIGNTRIKICDDVCRDATPQAVQTILDRITERAQDQLHTIPENHEDSNTCIDDFSKYFVLTFG